MALIECPECDEQISESVIGCPHCGFMLTRDIVAAQHEDKAKREQEAAETYKREERKMVIWMTVIAAAFVAVVVFCAITPLPNNYEPHWSEGVSDTNAATDAQSLNGFTPSEKETILQEAYLSDAAAQQLERDRDR